jgi:hypothetical protein
MIIVTANVGLLLSDAHAQIESVSLCADEQPIAFLELKSAVRWLRNRSALRCRRLTWLFTLDRG